MKALSVRQPWADLIVAGVKDVENRNWVTNFRGRVLIHAPRKVDHLAVLYVFRDLGLSSPDHYIPETGVIVGEVEIFDCVTEHPSKWFMGPFGFCLRNAQALVKPVQCRGRLGFFDPGYEVLRRVYQWEVSG